MTNYDWNKRLNLFQQFMEGLECYIGKPFRIHMFDLQIFRKVSEKRRDMTD